MTLKGIEYTAKQATVFFLSIFFLSLLVSLILEHYTRECEFGTFDKIKKTKKTQKNKITQKKTQTLLAEFLFK